MKKRFYYSHSIIFGWTVYDRETRGDPAWNTISSCINLKCEYEAIKLCEYLNKQHEKNINAKAWQEEIDSVGMEF